MISQWPPAVFVTGTDTGIGKTWVVTRLAKWLNQQGKRVALQKWVETGWNEPESDYAHYLDAVPSLKHRPIDDVVPYRLQLPASPHLAARLESIQLDYEWCSGALDRLMADFDSVIVEGAGGALVPVSDDDVLLDWVERRQLPLIVVVGNQLGCINHALLTLQVIQSRGLEVMAVIMNDLGRSPTEIERDNPLIVRQLGGIKTISTTDDWCSLIFD